ncbi:MAG: ribonuclease HII [Alphaproteobacteria bacterium]
MSKLVPDWSYEALYKGPVCGVDEAGRGPLSGPVVAGAVILDPRNIPKGLNDSKALSEMRREYLLNEILQTAYVSIGIAEPEEVDRINVLAASMIAMKRAVEGLGRRPVAALIDGNRTPDLKIPAEAIVKGDAKSLSIAAASIVAKVTRDRLMKQADARFPGFGFSGHKGYPTKMHRERLMEVGPCPIHRFSYAPVKAALK